ncbi:MAG: hypothetical protein IKO76_06085 [Butyrivibrio sp.]|nr:hypothetical protein [Butyrivibrio sp.]
MMIRKGDNMEGPRDRLFGHSAFDLNHDGKIDAAEWAFIEDTVFKEDNESDGENIAEDDYEDDFGDDFGE